MRKVSLGMKKSYCYAFAILCFVTGNAASVRGSNFGGSALPSTGQQTQSAASTSNAAAADVARPESLAEARALLADGKLTDAETATRQFLQGHADLAEGHFLLGQILFQELHERYAAEEKTEGESFAYGGTVGGDLGKLRDAKARESLAEFSAGTKYGSPTAADLKIAAFDNVLLKENLTAAKFLNAALKLDPTDAGGWFYLGRILYSQDQFANAIQAYEQCLKLQPRNALAEAGVGLSYEGLRQTDEAAQAYQAAIAWESDTEAKSPKPFIYLGRLYLSENQAEKALPYLQQAATEFPEVPVVHEQLGSAYSALNQPEQAQAELEKAVAMEPEVASVHFMLGQVYRRLGMLDKAKSEFEKAEKLNGTHSSDKPGT